MLRLKSWFLFRPANPMRRLFIFTLETVLLFLMGLLVHQLNQISGFNWYSSGLVMGALPSNFLLSFLAKLSSMARSAPLTNLIGFL